MRTLLPYLLLAPWLVTACDAGAPFEVADSSSTDDAGSLLPDAGAPDANDDDAEAGPVDPCPPPVDPKKAALCLMLQPEPIEFVPGEERFDGNGLLHVAIFDEAQPAPGDAPLFDRTIPSQGATPVLKPLAELVAEPIRFELSPGTVYARSIFLDDLAAFGATKLQPGLWLGGFDLANGLVEDPPLLPIELQEGKGHLVEVDLHALRQLQITVSRGKATPLGDGEGPLMVLAFDSRELEEGAKVFGLATEDCVDLDDDGTVTTEGVLFGTGPRWLSAAVNDFGQTGTWPGGALVSLDWQQMKIPAEHELVYEPQAYKVEKTIEMRGVTPLFGDLKDHTSCDE